MKFTLSWLKEHLDTKASLDEIAETLTRIGLEVEEVFDPADQRSRPSRWPKVVKAEKHPNADKLLGLRGRYRHRAPAGRVRRAECARRAQRRICAGRQLRSRHRSHPHQGQDQGRRVRTACCSSERELELSDEHTGIIELAPTPRSEALRQRRSVSTTR